MSLTRVPRVAPIRNIHWHTRATLDTTPRHDRYDNAQSLGETIKSASAAINYLKKHIEQLRVERAMHGLSEGGKEGEAPPADPEEERQKAKLSDEKTKYKTSLTALKKAKVEIEGMQRSLQASRRRMQNDFDSWYSQALAAEGMDVDAYTSAAAVAKSAAEVLAKKKADAAARSQSSGGGGDGDGKSGEGAIAYPGGVGRMARAAGATSPTRGPAAAALTTSPRRVAGDAGGGGGGGASSGSGSGNDSGSGGGSAAAPAPGYNPEYAAAIASAKTGGPLPPEMRSHAAAAHAQAHSHSARALVPSPISSSGGGGDLGHAPAHHAGGAAPYPHGPGGAYPPPGGAYGGGAPGMVHGAAPAHAHPGYAGYGGGSFAMPYGQGLGHGGAPPSGGYAVGAGGMPAGYHPSMPPPVAQSSGGGGGGIGRTGHAGTDDDIAAFELARAELERRRASYK